MHHGYGGALRYQDYSFHQNIETLNQRDSAIHTVEQIRIFKLGISISEGSHVRFVDEEPSKEADENNDIPQH